MTDEIELIYFTLQGRGTLIRIMLNMSGCQWTDTRIPADRAIWNEQKATFDEIALGTLPILKLNGHVYCQSEAIVEWATHKAGIAFNNEPLVRMQIKMITETLHETTKNAFAAGMAQVGKLPDISSLSGEESRERRNRVLIPTMVDTFKATLGNIEKVFAMLNVDKDAKFIFGDTISLADLSCLAYTIFFADGEFNKYGAMAPLLTQYAPTVVSVAARAKTHPAVADYMVKDGANRYAGLNVLWWE